MMIWRIFCRWRNETACDSNKIHNEVLNDPYSSPTIFRLIISRRINLAGYVACRLSGESYRGFW